MSRSRLWRAVLTGALSVPVQIKIMGIALGVIFLLGLAMTLQVRAILMDRMLEELQQRGVAVARDTAGRATDLILTDNLFALQELVRSTMENNGDVRYVFVVGRDGQVLAHTFGQHFPPALGEVNRAGEGERFRLQPLETEEGVVYDLAVPILEGMAGVARVGMSERRLGAAVQRTTELLLMVTLLVSLLGVVGAYVLTVVLTRPMLQLVEVTRAVARGDFSRKAPVWAEDEIGRLGRAFNAMTEALERSRREVERKEELQRQLLEKLILAQEEERKRVARELHDEVGQSLTAVIMGLGSVEEALPASLQPVRDQLEQCRSLTATTLEGIRRLMVDLRPTLLDDLGLISAIRWYADAHLTRAGVQASVEVVGSRRRLPPVVETALFRVTQEAITNIVRHAEASQARIRLDFGETAIGATIEDNGRGFDPREPRVRTGLGLLGMAERVTLLGGTLRVDSEPSGGTRIGITIPLHESALEPAPEPQPLAAARKG